MIKLNKTIKAIVPHVSTLVGNKVKKIVLMLDLKDPYITSCFALY